MPTLAKSTLGVKHNLHFPSERVREPRPSGTRLPPLTRVRELRASFDPVGRESPILDRLLAPLCIRFVCARPRNIRDCEREQNFNSLLLDYLTSDALVLFGDFKLHWNPRLVSLLLR